MVIRTPNTSQVASLESVSPFNCYEGARETMELEGGEWGEWGVGCLSFIHTPTKCTPIFTFLLFLFFWQEIQISIAHIKAEVLEVFVEGHDLFLRVGVHPPKQCALYGL